MRLQQAFCKHVRLGTGPVNGQPQGSGIWVCILALQQTHVVELAAIVEGKMATVLLGETRCADTLQRLCCLFATPERPMPT